MTCADDAHKWQHPPMTYVKRCGCLVRVSICHTCGEIRADYTQSTACHIAHVSPQPETATLQ